MEEKDLNVFGDPLAVCGTDPLTGFYRNGCCSTGDQDYGTHTVCAIVTQDFLEYSRSMGNDLITPNPAFNFPGLKPGDRWCLCVSRWLQAYHAGVAPKIDLQATHQQTLKYVDWEVLEEFAVSSS